MGGQALQKALDLKDEKHSLEDRLVEMTVPDKPLGSKRKYRWTDRGREAL